MSISEDLKTKECDVCTGLLDSRYQNLLETIPHGIEESDCDGRITFANRALHKMYGCEENILLGTYIWDRLETQSETQSLKEYLAYLIKEQPPREPYKTKKFKMDSQEMIDVQVDWNYLRDKEGRVKGFISIITDVTERNRAERELQKSEQKFRELAENIDDVFWIASAAFDKVHYVSPAYESIWGRSCESLYENPIDWVNGIYAEDQEKVYEALTDQINGHAKFKVVYRVVRPDNSIRWIHDQGYALKGADGEVERIVGVAKDITALHDAEALNQKHLAELAHFSRLTTGGEMASSIAHELNQPLSALVQYIGGCLIKLERYEIEQDIIEHMQDATVQAERAGKIIHTLKDFLRKDTSQRMNVNLNELINNAMRLLSHDFHNQEINVVLNLSEDLPSSIMEKIQIEQVIINLMRNGLEAMNELDDESSKRLTVSTSTSGDAVLMTVADLGCGISSSNKDKIFEAFFSTKEQGMGMGLSICRSIIENHHGKLHVRENKPYGTIFELELPFEREFA